MIYVLFGLVLILFCFSLYLLLQVLRLKKAIISVIGPRLDLHENRLKTLAKK